MDDDRFIHKIPKAELHVHIEGTLEPELLLALSARNQIKLPYSSIEAVREAYQFKNLQSFLDVYYQASQVLITEKDFYDLAFAYLQKANEQNVHHAEIFFDPQSHTRRGIAFATFMQGFIKATSDAKKKFGMTIKWIMCFMRDLSEKSAMETLKEAMSFKDHIVAVGLDSAEKGNPPENFAKVYAKARKAGFQATAHAGEEGGADYIWQALDILKVSRIDHGIRCLEDPKLVARLVKDKITLTVCPLSNVKLQVVKNIQQHPLKKMLEAKLQATVNSDDPAYFGGYIEENFLEVQSALKLSQTNIYQLVKNAFNGSFISTAEKNRLLAQLESFYAKSMIV